MSGRMTTTEAARRWGVIPRRVLQWIAEGRVKAERVGRDWLIPTTERKPEPLPRGPRGYPGYKSRSGASRKGSRAAR